MIRDNLSYHLYQPALPGTQSSQHRQPQHPPTDLHPLSLPHPLLHHHPKGWETAWKAGGMLLSQMLRDQQHYPKSKSGILSETSPSRQVSNELELVCNDLKKKINVF